MYLKEIQLYMSRAYGPGSYDASYEKQGRDYPFSYVRWTENRNMEEFLRLVGRGDIRFEPLITHRFPSERWAARPMPPSWIRLRTAWRCCLKYPAATHAG